jgi:hypothetical protein
MSMMLSHTVVRILFHSKSYTLYYLKERDYHFGQFTGSPHLIDHDV